MAQEEYDISMGTAVYTEDGTKLGSIRGFDESGFYVTLSARVHAPTPGRATATGKAGEADLMWRCWQCGEVGEIEDIPETCPSCGAGAEELYYWTED